MVVVPPQTLEQWLADQFSAIQAWQGVVMATLNDILQKQQETDAKVADLQQREGAQSAAITGLADSQAALIALVQELRTNLSAEEQAVVDEVMASQASTLGKITAVLAGTGVQSDSLTSLKAAADAAAGGGTPTPTP